MNLMKYPHLLSSLSAVDPGKTCSINLPLVSLLNLSLLLYTSQSSLFSLSSFLPLTFINSLPLLSSMPHLEFTAGVSLCMTFIYNYLWQGSAGRNKDRMFFVFFFHSLPCLPFRSHPSLRSVWAHLGSIQPHIWWDDSNINKMPAITGASIIPFSLGIYWVMNAKGLTLKSFYFWTTFSLVACYAVIGAFLSTASPRLTLTALIFIITSPVCTPKYTR